jgi:hypothetical protein
MGLTAEINRDAEGIEAIVEDPKKWLWEKITGGLKGLQAPFIPDTTRLPPATPDEDWQRRQQILDRQLGLPPPPGSQQRPVRTSYPPGLRFVTDLDSVELPDHMKPPPARPAAPSSSPAREFPGKMKDDLSSDMSGAADASMDGYLDRLKQALGTAASDIAGEVAKWKAMLDFSAGPTIRPTFLPPSGAPAPDAPQKQSMLVPGGGTSIGTINQHISTPHSKLAALRARREMNRAVAMAQYNSIGEQGSAFG